MIDPTLLGTRVAEALGEGPSAERRLAQRERLVRASSIDAPAPARAGRFWIAALAATVIAAVSIYVFAWPASDPVEPEQIAAHEGRWLEAPADGAVQLDLAEGTWVRVVEGARARVSSASGEGGRISLESGRVEVEIDPTAAQRWTVEAGPYEVVVVGTVFSVQWDPTTGVDVEVVRGKVVVRGESLGADSIAVEAGHRLRANHTRRTATLSPLRTEPEIVAAAPEETAPEEEPAIDLEESASDSSPRRAKRPVAPTWKSEASAANYAAALELARAQGLDRLLADLPAGDLLLLAETARLAKDRTLARRTYERVRTRFGKSSQASRAAFQLGRLAADGAGKHTEAAQWFATYLRETPNGAFAREARGRMVQSLDRAGDAAGARKAAKVYLSLHPTGPHAKLARSIAGAEP